MSLIVNLRSGAEVSEVRCQRINPDPLIEGNLLIEGVGSLELRLSNGDRMLPHTMSVPRAAVIGYYGGELVTADELAAETEAFLKKASLAKSAAMSEEDSPRSWPGIEGTSFSA